MTNVNNTRQNGGTKTRSQQQKVPFIPVNVVNHLLGCFVTNYKFELSLTLCLGRTQWHCHDPYHCPLFLGYQEEWQRPEKKE